MKDHVFKISMQRKIALCKVYTSKFKHVIDQPATATLRAGNTSRKKMDWGKDKRTKKHPVF